MVFSYWFCKKITIKSLELDYDNFKWQKITIGSSFKNPKNSQFQKIYNIKNLITISFCWKTLIKIPSSDNDWLFQPKKLLHENQICLCHCQCCIASGGRLREKTRTTTSAQVLLRAALPCLSSSSHLIFAATATG